MVFENNDREGGEQVGGLTGTRDQGFRTPLISVETQAGVARGKNVLLIQQVMARPISIWNSFWYEKARVEYCISK